MTINYDVFYGRLGKKPELKYTIGPKAICTLSVAVSKKDSEKPDWRKVTVWGRQAEICSVQLDKGSEIFVQGQNKKHEYTDKLGEKRFYEEVNARLIGFSNI